MNIIMVTTRDGLLKPKSGGQNRFYNLAKGLVKRGNHVIVLEPSVFREDEDQIIGIKRYYFNVYHICTRRLTIPPDLNIDFILKILKILRIKKIDVIQIRSFRGFIITKLMTTLRHKKIPIIYDAHNVESDITKYNFTKGQKSSLKSLFFTCSTTILEKLAVNHTDHIIAVSRDDKNRFIEIYRVNERKITVIPNGVDIIDLTTLNDKNKIKKQFGIGINRLTVIFHGSFFWFPNKEAINLIINYIAPKIMKINPNVLFVIAGSGVPCFEKDNIKSIGFVEDIYSLIHAADIAIAPLLGGGGTRLKILDYMSVGVPIVTTKKGIEGINAKNGEDAIIVNAVDEEFIDVIIHLANNKEERERIGANARKLAEEEYDWNKIGKKLDGLYRNILTEFPNANK